MSETKNIDHFIVACRAERQQFDTLYQEVYDYMQPQRAEFTQTITPGQTNDRNLYTEAGILNAESFANGLKSRLNSPLSRWFDCDIESDEALEAQDEEVVFAWRDSVVDWMYSQINGDRSSFYPMVQENYLDMGLAGYGVGFSEWCKKDKMAKFQSWFPGEVYLSEDSYGTIDGLLRCYKESGSNLVAHYRDALEDSEAHAIEQRSDKITIEHVIMPRDHYSVRDIPAVKALPPKFKYASVRRCASTRKQILSVGGYISFPGHIARWGKRSGYVYPTSPGQNVLTAVKRLNAAEYDMTIIMNRNARPVTQGPDDEFLAPFSMNPGTHNFYNPGLDGRFEVVGPPPVDLNGALAWIEKMENLIAKGFYIDAFLSTQDSNGQNVKAAFVDARQRENLSQLASILSRPEREYNGSIIRRLYELGIENGQIEKPPLSGIRLKVKYISPVVRAQRGEQVQALLATYEAVLPFAQQDPTILEGFDKFGFLEFVGRDVNSLPVKLFKTRQALESALQQKQAEASQQNQLAQSQAAKNYAGALKDAAQAGSEGLF